MHASAFLRARSIVLDAALRKDPDELARILTHEIFHFAWVRLGNARRRSYEELVASEIRAGAAGELGWSSEWRKQRLRAFDRTARTRRWREYSCESFCDTGAWLFAKDGKHPELTLPGAFRARRRRWLEESGLSSGVRV